MNQRFTIRAVIEYTTWPGKDNVADGTAEACARSRIQGILDREIAGATVLEATVVGVTPIPLGRPGCPV